MILTYLKKKVYYILREQGVINSRLEHEYDTFEKEEVVNVL